MEYVIKDVIGDGSCFYRSVYNAAKRAGCIDEVTACLIGASPNNASKMTKRDMEKLFVQGVRNAIADRIEAKEDDGVIRGTYENLRGMNAVIFEQVMEGMPDWIADEFTAQMPRSEAEFREKIAAGVRKMKNWACEIDVTIFKNMFDRCVHSVSLVILNKKKLSTNFVLEPGHIYVWNIKERHYKYVVPEYQLTPCPPGTIRNPETGFCVKIEGKLGQSILSRSSVNRNISIKNSNNAAKAPSRKASPKLEVIHEKSVSPKMSQLNKKLSNLKIKPQSPLNYTGRITRSMARTATKK